MLPFAVLGLVAAFLAVASLTGPSAGVASADSGSVSLSTDTGCADAVANTSADTASANAHAAADCDFPAIVFGDDTHRYSHDAENGSVILPGVRFILLLRHLRQERL